jgi:hypothetical protein
MAIRLNCSRMAAADCFAISYALPCKCRGKVPLVIPAPPFETFGGCDPLEGGIDIGLLPHDAGRELPNVPFRNRLIPSQPLNP